jgi:hypothetical protein
MAAMADVLMRYDASDERSLCCDAFSGRISDRGLGGSVQERVYGASAALFAKAAQVTLMTSPELILAKTRVLDYFEELNVTPKSEVMSWELEGYSMAPGKATLDWLGTVARIEHASDGICRSSRLLSGRDGVTIITAKYPEFVAYRDVTFYWKFFSYPSE